MICTGHTSCSIRHSLYFTVYPVSVRRRQARLPSSTDTLGARLRRQILMWVCLAARSGVIV